MGIARSLERRLERLIDGIAAAVFGGRLHPVELANRLVREADLLVEEGVAGPRVPNHFEVRLHTDELSEEIDLDSLERELANVVTTTAMDRGWRLDGPVAVEVTIDPSVSPGSMTCRAATVVGPLPAWGHLVEERGTRIFDLGPLRVVIGRAPYCDVTVPEPAVSRVHATLWREGGHVWIRDEASSNGTTVNGVRVAGAVAISPGDLLAFGPVALTFRRS